jgi:hypothetical protein
MIDPPIPSELTQNSTHSEVNKPALSQLKWLFLAVALYFAFNFLLPLIPVPMKMAASPPIGLLIVSTLVFMLLQIWLPWRVAALSLSTGRNLLLAAALGILWFACLYLIHPYMHASQRMNSVLFHFSAPLRGLTETLALTFLGCGVSMIVREAKILLPVCIVAIIIDFVGAMTPIGFTNNIIAQHPEIVHAVSVAVPKFGALHPLSYFGPGDALFVGFFLSIVVRLKLNAHRTLWSMYALLSVAMLMVLTIDLDIAALVPMGIAVIAANYQEFKFSREEAFAMLYSGICVIALTMAFFVYNHRHVIHHH